MWGKINDKRHHQHNHKGRREKKDSEKGDVMIKCILVILRDLRLQEEKQEKRRRETFFPRYFENETSKNK